MDRKIKTLLSIGVLGLMGTPLSAAPFEEQSDVDPFSFYIRGDLTFSNFNNVETHVPYDLKEYNPSTDEVYHEGEYNGLINIDDGDFTALNMGAGMQFNRQNIRLEATFTLIDVIDTDYNAELKMYDPLYYNNDEPTTELSFNGSYETNLFMINAYIDASDTEDPYSNFFLPYIGFGIGYAMHSIDSMEQVDENEYDHDPDNPGGNPPVSLDPLPTEIKANITDSTIATALHAGIGFNIGNFIVIDLGYSYIDLGDIKISIPEYQAELSEDGSADDEFISLRSVGEHKVPSKLNQFRGGIRIVF
jgi:opacity protein-like surface antigen